MFKKIAITFITAMVSSLIGMWLIFFLLILTIGWFFDLTVVDRISYLVSCYVISVLITFFGMMGKD